MDTLWVFFYSSSMVSLGFIIITLIVFLTRKSFNIKHLKSVWIFIAVCMLLPLNRLVLPYTRFVEVTDYIISGNGFEISLRNVFAVLWLLVMAGLLAYYGIGYVCMYRKSVRWSKESENQLVDRILQETASEIKLKNIPEVRVLEKNARGPFTTGIIRNIVFLSKEDVGESDLKYVLKHEMIHCKNKDILWEVFFVFLCSTYWFNPLVWYMRKLFRQDMEIACDLAVVSNFSMTEKKEYCDVIMSYVGEKRKGYYAVTTGYVHSLAFLKRRFSGILEKPTVKGNIRTSLYTGILGVLVLLISTSAGFNLGEKYYLFGKQYMKDAVDDDEVAETQETVAVESEDSSLTQIKESEMVENENTPELLMEEILDTSEETITKLTAGILDECHNMFEGTVGNMDVAMKVTRIGDAIDVDIITSDDIEMAFSGTIMDNRKAFYATNEEGEYVLGYIVIDEENLYSLRGNVVLTGEKEAVEMDLSMHTFYDIGDDLEDYYSFNKYITITSNEAEVFAKEIKDKISDKEAFAKLIRYPMYIYTSNEKIRIENEEMMLSFYDTLMSLNDFRSTIENITTKYMFANYMGVSMGLGEIWFSKDADGDCWIYAINL